MKDITQEIPVRKTDERLSVLVVGATGGSGRATVERLLEEGHKVTAFSRSATSIPDSSGRLVTINGDATNPIDIERAVRGQDVVIVTLGITENPLRVRFFGPSRTPANVRSEGTRNIILAMRKNKVPRLVVQSSYGVGETRGLLRFIDRLFVKLLLKPQMDDTEVQEELVRDSGVDWVLAQPVHLTDNELDLPPFVSEKGQVRAMKVARKSVAQFLSFAACEPDYVGKSMAISN